MEVSHKFLIFLIVIGLAYGDDNGNLSDKCAAEFQKVTACLNYATGKDTAPTKQCCDSAAAIQTKDAVCLCFIIQQIHKGTGSQLKSMGIQEEKLIQLPSACKLANANISDCPKLLNIPPNSPDAAIFTNASRVTATPSQASSATAKDSSAGYKHDLSLAGKTLVLALAILLCAILQDLLMA